MTQTTPTLYCLKCGYNLTGNATDSCPECGAGFDPAGLQAEIAQLAGLTSGRVFKQVFIPAMVLAVVLVSILSAVFLAEGFGTRLNEEYLAVFLSVLGIPSIIYLIYNDWTFTQRLAFRRMTHLDIALTSSRLRNFRIMCCGLLLLGQALLGVLLIAAGCFGVCIAVMGGGFL